MPPHAAASYKGLAELAVPAAFEAAMKPGLSITDSVSRLKFYERENNFQYFRTFFLRNQMCMDVVGFSAHALLPLNWQFETDPNQK